MKSIPKLQQIVTQIAHKHGVDLDRAGAHLRLALAGHGQLVIENIGASRVSVTNYIEVNRDGLPTRRLSCTQRSLWPRRCPRRRRRSGYRWRSPNSSVAGASTPNWTCRADWCCTIQAARLHSPGFASECSPAI